MRLQVDPSEHRITFGDTAEFELSGLTATAACQLLVRPCLRVTKGRKLEKSANGAITLDFSLANYSGLDLGITINLKRTTLLTGTVGTSSSRREPGHFFSIN